LQKQQQQQQRSLVCISGTYPQPFFFHRLLEAAVVGIATAAGIRSFLSSCACLLASPGRESSKP